MVKISLITAALLLSLTQAAFSQAVSDSARAEEAELKVLQERVKQNEEKSKIRSEALEKQAEIRDDELEKEIAQRTEEIEKRMDLYLGFVCAGIIFLGFLLTFLGPRAIVNWVNRKSGKMVEKAIST